MNEQTRSIIHDVNDILSTVRSVRALRWALLIAAAPLLVAGCGGSDDGGPPAAGNTNQLLQCGSSELYAAKHDVCGAMDAKAAAGEGDSHCNCMMGFAWNGTECVGLGDCACAGADCDKLTKTIEQCEQQHASCVAAPPSFACGSSKLFEGKHEACTAMDAKGAPDENGSGCFCMLGYAWNGTECVGLGDCRCVGADCDKLTQTIEACQQKHTSCAAASPYHCGSPALHAKQHDLCSAMDATGSVDHCNCGNLGFRWNGQACVDLGDSCTCTGADCDKLTVTQQQCESLHAQCTN